MSTPLPGQIRCPTCHRSTPPAAFCTQCGTAIPESARARPRGLDREELQDRIRTHRPGDAAFRRGSQLGGAAEQGPSAYRPFQAEPEDELVLPGAAAADVAAAHIDNTPPDFDTPPPPPPVEPLPVVAPPVEPSQIEPAAAAPLAEEPTPVVTPQPAPVVPDASPPSKPKPAPWKAAPVPPPPPPIEQAAPAPPQSAASDDPYAAADTGGPDYRYRDPDDWDRRGPGMSPLAIGGFVLLGVLAIGVGAFMAGLFSGGTAVGSPSPTPVESVLPSATVQPSLGPSTNPSAPGSPSPTGTPVPLPDEFSARTEPCAEQPASQDGCGSSGATVTGGSVWIWVGWRKGSDADTLGVHIEDATGASVGTGSLALSSIGKKGCGPSCNGWARFKFGGLDPGDYTIRVDRNGAEVATGSFTVNS